MDKRALPPLTALRAFEAFARRGRMTLAADELCVTHGAISRQIRSLEEAVGLAVALDWVSPQRSKNLNHMGIGHLYLFGEWMNAMLDGLGSRPQLHVGTSTFVGGLALDF